MKNMKKLFIYSFITLLLATGCGSNESAEYTADQMMATGEFLFEGPNTLQGSFELTTENIARSLSVDGTTSLELTSRLSLDVKECRTKN